jgi:hypothetical protein
LAHGLEQRDEVRIDRYISDALGRLGCLDRVGLFVERLGDVNDARLEVDIRPEERLEFPRVKVEVTGDRVALARVARYARVSDECSHIDAILEEERQHLQVSNAIQASRMVTEQPPSEDQKARYLKGYGEWFVTNRDSIIRSRLRVSVEVEVTNSGRGTATDIDVQLMAPENVFFRKPVEDPPPSPTRPRWQPRFGRILDQDFIKQMSADSQSAFSVAAVVNGEALDAYAPHLAGFRLREMKHSTSRVVTVPIWFDDREAVLAMNGFSIEYKVHPANPPDILEGELHVKLDAQEVQLSTYDITYHIQEVETEDRR